jgi:endoglucanase
MKKVFFVFTLVMMLIVPVNASSNVSALNVKNGKLVNAQGHVVQLKGISTHGINWFPQYINQKTFNDLKKKKCDVIRLAMYTQEYNGYTSGGSKSALLKLIDQGVTYAKKAHMYVIIDWHILSDGNPLTHLKEAKAFFSKVSKKYKRVPNVMYEICSEPNNTSWRNVKTYAKKVIPVIRKNTKTPIIIGTTTWSQDVDQAANDPIKGKNLMYAFHFYAGTHHQDLRNKLISALKKKLPIFVSEYGVVNADGNGQINKTEANKWAKLMDRYKLSSCMWNLSNKNEASSILKANCQKLSGFQNRDLTASGKWLMKYLKK